MKKKPDREYLLRRANSKEYHYLICRDESFFWDNWNSFATGNVLVSCRCLEAFNYYSWTESKVTDYVMYALYGNNKTLINFEDLSFEDCDSLQWNQIDHLLIQSVFDNVEIEYSKKSEYSIKEDVQIQILIPDVIRVEVNKIFEVSKYQVNLFDTLTGIYGKTGIIWESVPRSEEIEYERYLRSIRWKALLWMAPYLNKIKYHVFMVENLMRECTIQDYQVFTFYRSESFEKEVLKTIKDFFKFLSRPPED